jgi:uncharacterized protein YqgC (DUF456 family)
VGEGLLTIVLGLLMLIGLAGAIIPVLPDLWLIWVAALGYGVLIGWGARGVWLFAAVTLLGGIGILSEVVVGGAGARRAGSSFWGILAGFGLGVVGLIAAGPLGGLLGLLVGIFTVEYMRVKDADRAARAMLGMGLGLGASLIVKLILGVLMIATWLVWVFWR